ncbi:response regulator [Azospirillum picis]|uniref:DNA-binding response OmpR family regulator n=1 Tax=Azospirillum picis TaxID=488438 RepID=A0ABU0MP13_9PROT|nr:response regulator [Azospirillum picis]MBP2301376.1 DNA-binding response OmpR family regulator [Azospirillum picis]MDQ0535207.1 DNA-binding response OmpR family regulator [Azospirillum picis]
MKILLVEDEVLIALEQQFYLETAGYTVSGPATTAGEAVAIAGDEKPDLALVDVHLGQGSSGIDAARDLAAIGVPSLFITSFRDELKKGGPVAGIGCLPKPFTESGLLAAVDAARAVLAGETPRNVPQTMELFV